MSCAPHFFKNKNLSSQRTKGYFRDTTSIRQPWPARSVRIINRLRDNGRTRAVLLTRFAHNLNPGFLQHSLAVTSSIPRLWMLSAWGVPSLAGGNKLLFRRLLTI
ncbi:MAG: hypothetical protein GX142_01390 [Chloroflexi bacterium]|jgi:hypothetical protein|nr:hypothetical protein [Chloroflexota bacterium]